MHSGQAPAFVFHAQRMLRLERNTPLLELDRQHLAVDGLEVAAMQLAMHFHRGTDDLECLGIRVKVSHVSETYKMRSDRTTL